MRSIFRILTAGIVFFAATFSFASESLATEVTLAGLAYAGDAQSIPERFPYSIRYENALRQAGDSTYARTRQAAMATPPQSLVLSDGQIDDLKGRDQAVVMSLLVNSETVSIERFGELRKLLVLVRGQSLFFDFKSMTVIRAYPLSFAYIDVLQHDPSDEEITERIKLVYEGTRDKPGIYQRFGASLAKAVLPSTVSRHLQVTSITLADTVRASLPDSLKTKPEIADTWAADLVSEAISTRIGVPVIPYVKGYAIGNVMSMRVSDGTVFMLSLPTPDYEISVDLTGFKKVKYGESAAGASYIYGSFATIRIEEPMSRTRYLDTAIKNGEVKLVPATQGNVDDFPAFYDSLNGMFGKLADTINGGGDGAWIKAAAAAPDILAQINKTKELMNLCK